MHSAVICLGSNLADGPRRIRQALDLLSLEGCTLISSSGVYQLSTPYFNYVATFMTDGGYDWLVAMTKDIERRLGRLPQHKGRGVVPIDIDVVVFDDAVMRPADYNAPYFVYGYDHMEL